MEKINKLYKKFLEETLKDEDKEVIRKKFDRIFKKIKFTHQEELFNREFVEMLFRRKKIK